MEDTLVVSFCSSEEDSSGLCVARRYGEHTGLIKMEIGEQADILYRLLTEQKTKAEIKAESEGTHKVRWINDEMTTIDPQIKKDFREMIDKMEG